jgi:uncharacterized oligopeptide transporter (OPT) family protein
MIHFIVYELIIELKILKWGFILGFIFISVVWVIAIIAYMVGLIHGLFSKD